MWSNLENFVLNIVKMKQRKKLVEGEKSMAKRKCLCKYENKKGNI